MLCIVQDLIAKCPKKCPVSNKQYFPIAWQTFVITVETVVSGHPRDVKKVSVTGAGHLWECKNTEFVWELRIMVAISRAVRLH